MCLCSVATLSADEMAYRTSNEHGEMVLTGESSSTGERQIVGTCVCWPGVASARSQSEADRWDRRYEIVENNGENTALQKCVLLRVVNSNTRNVRLVSASLNLLRV
jgi:hypothetical protein